MAVLLCYKQEVTGVLLLNSGAKKLFLTNEANTLVNVMTELLSEKQIGEIIASISDKEVSNVQRLVLFVGHAHSGHSLIGALLDTCRDTAISNHLNIPNLLLTFDSLRKRDVFKVVLHYSQKNSLDSGWQNTGYSYRVPDSYQGVYNQPVLVGDKQGGASTRTILNNPDVFSQLQHMFKEELVCIFVERDFLDVIAAYSHYMKEPLAIKHVDRYFQNLQVVIDIKKSLKSSQWIHIKHEEFIFNPYKNLNLLFSQLGLKVVRDQTLNAANIVRKAPNHRHSQIIWPDKVCDRIKFYLKDPEVHQLIDTSSIRVIQ